MYVHQLGPHDLSNQNSNRQCEAVQQRDEGAVALGEADAEEAHGRAADRLFRVQPAYVARTQPALVQPQRPANITCIRICSHGFYQVESRYCANCCIYCRCARALGYFGARGNVRYYCANTRACKGIPFFKRSARGMLNEAPGVV